MALTKEEKLKFKTAMNVALVQDALLMHTRAAHFTPEEVDRIYAKANKALMALLDEITKLRRGK